MFECTKTLRGRLTPYPHYPHLYVVDFTNADGMLVDDAANLGVYDAGSFGNEKLFEMKPLGSLPSRRATTDRYVLNPGRVCKIRLRDSGAPVHTISILVHLYF